MLILTLSIALICLLLMSGFFSGSETGIMSASSIKASSLANKGDKKTIKLLALLSDKQKIIIMILAFTNIVNTTYTIVGEILINNFFAFFKGSTSHESVGVFVTTIILTPPLVVFSEIFPKSLFRHYSFSLTRIISPVLYLLKFLCSPLLAAVFIFKSSQTQRRLKLFKNTKESLNLLLESGTDTGKILGLQEKIIKHVLSLSNITLSDIHSSLHSILVLNSNMRGKQAIQFIKDGKKSSPYLIKRKDKYIGHISLKTLWAMNENEKIENHCQALPRLSAKKSGLMGLDHLLHTRTEYALVTEEKQVVGLLSLKDVLTPCI